MPKRPMTVSAAQIAAIDGEKPKRRNPPMDRRRPELDGAVARPKA